MKPIHTPFADTGGTESAASIWLHRLAKLVVGATFVLIFVGGLVTSKDSGLAVPDWPTTYGHFMFAFPLSQMVGGILYEHSHRLIATGALLLGTSVVMALGTHRLGRKSEPTSVNERIAEMGQPGKWSSHVNTGPN